MDIEVPILLSLGLIILAASHTGGTLQQPYGEVHMATN